MKRVREECYDNEIDSGLDDEEYESDGIDDCLFQTFRSYYLLFTLYYRYTIVMLCYIGIDKYYIN